MAFIKVARILWYYNHHEYHYLWYSIQFTVIIISAKMIVTFLMDDQF